MPASSSNTSKLNPKPALQPPTTCYSTPTRDHKPVSQSKPTKNHILHKDNFVSEKFLTSKTFLSAKMFDHPTVFIQICQWKSLVTKKLWSAKIFY